MFWGIGSKAEASPAPAQQTVRVHGAPVPVDWLLTKHDPQKFPDAALSTAPEIRQANRSLSHARHREEMMAAAAAGVHLALFSFNLAFWGFEGTPPDRYNPTNLRLRLGVRPGRYGNMDGTKRIYYDNLARMEGVD